VDSNTVMNNDQALVNGNCTVLPEIEPGEAMDCGEGIHLQAADHSVVSNNTVTNNSGGILLSDDTGANHDNLVSFNTSMNNAFACGIVLASHAQAMESPSTTPLGVYHNTVYGNRSQGNGFAEGGGAGIGLFASVPGAMTFGNVVVDNLVSGNGHPGISIHSHTPGQNVNDNMLVGNTVVGNGADTADATTPGPTGIDVYSLTPATGIMISGNSFQSESYDVAVHVPAVVEVHENGFDDGTGLINLGAGTVDATQNYWGCSNGPVLFPPGCSQEVGAGVTAFPVLQQSIPPQPNY
jgi:parallel beta-helix repeat protein